MKLSNWIPPVLANLASRGVAVAKSAYAAAFIRGADLDGPLLGAGRMMEPYAQSAWVNRAIKLKVDEIARVPLKFYDGKVEYTDRDFLAWWQTPFLTSSGQLIPLLEVRKQLASWPDLGGEFFIILGDDWLLSLARRNWRTLSRPIIARPDRMRHVIEAGKIIGWVFTDAGSRQHTLLPEQVIHAPEWNPYDDFRGLATVKVVFNAAEADYLAGLYVRNLMRNNGDQGVYVIAKGGLPSDAQREQIIASLREKRSRALRGDFAPVFLTGDITVEDAKAGAPDADFVSGRQANQGEVFSGLGVPPSLATAKASYSIGADSDRFTLITGSSMPLSAKVDSALSRIASLMTGRTLTAESDWDDHPVVQEVRRQRIKTALDLWGAGMSWRDINAYLDLGMKAFGGWAVAYLPFNVAPVSVDPAELPALGGDPATSPEFNEDLPIEEDDQVKSLRLLVSGRQRSRFIECKRVESEEVRIAKEFSAFGCACHGGKMIAQKSERPPAEIAHWRTLMAQRRETLKSFQSALGRLLMQARIETLRKIDSHYEKETRSATAVTEKAIAADLAFGIHDFTVAFRPAMENQHRVALQKAGEQLFAELGKKDAFSFPPQDALEFLKRRLNKLADAPHEIWNTIKGSLEDGITAGDSRADLAARVKQAFNQISDGRARTIAQTETGAVYGAGRAKGMEEAGVQWKRWLTSGNDNVRDAHAEANGQIVPFDEPFNVDGEELDYPGDDEGSAGNVINCHCVSVAEAEGPKDKS